MPLNILNMIQLAGAVSSAIMTVFGVVALYFGYKTKLKGGIKNSVREMVGIDLIVQEMKESRICQTEHSESLDKVKDALKCVLRKEIKEICDECLDKEFVTNEELEVIIKHNESYEKLKGNSFIHNLVDRVRELPMGNGD